MDELKNKLTNMKDKVVGQGKEKLGKVLDDNELELKGKLQEVKADIMENVEDGLEDFKDGVAGKLNKLFDKVKDDKNKSK